MLKIWRIKYKVWLSPGVSFVPIAAQNLTSVGSHILVHICMISTPHLVYRILPLYILDGSFPVLLDLRKPSNCTPILLPIRNITETNIGAHVVLFATNMHFRWFGLLYLDKMNVIFRLSIGAF